MLKSMLAVAMAGSLALVLPEQSHAGGDGVLGEVRQFGGTFAPRGWAFCAGQVLPITSYTSLFSVLGTSYGGNGRTTFQLPDLRKLEDARRKSTGDKDVSRYIICIQGTYPSKDAVKDKVPVRPDPRPASSPDGFLGEVRMFGGKFAPRNWLYCEGQKLPIKSNQALYSLLGTTYGGDGRTTFHLPDLRKVENATRTTTGDRDVSRYIICIKGIFPSRN